MLTRNNAVIVGVGWILAVAIFIAFLPTRTGQDSAATVSFLGFTNSATGLRFGLFRITNPLDLRIARNGYCRFGGKVVDIVPSRNLEPGESHTVEVPLAGILPNEEYEITFNGVRDFDRIDNLLDLPGHVLQRVGIHWQWLDMGGRRRWEARCEFRGDTEPGGAANGSQPVRSGMNTTSSAAGSRR